MNRPSVPPQGPIDIDALTKSIRALEQEVAKLDSNEIRFRVIGDISRFEPRIRSLIAAGEQRTAENRRLTLTVAANYGGRWDIAQAVQKLLAAQPDAAQGFAPEALEPYLAMAYAPEPDLFIRTGGEQRVSNFLLWQLAYTELWSSEVLWPESQVDLTPLHPTLAQNSRSEVHTLPTHLNEDVAFLLGALVAEGTVRKNVIEFTNLPGEYADAFQAAEPNSRQANGRPSWSRARLY
jgi:hypothetical protein